MEKVVLGSWTVGMLQENLCFLVNDTHLMMVTPENVYALLEAFEDDSVLEFAFPTQLMVRQEGTYVTDESYDDDENEEYFRLNYNFPVYHEFEEAKLNTFKIGDVQDCVLVFSSWGDKKILEKTLWEDPFGLETVSFKADQARLTK